MVAVETYRKIALSFPETSEEPHFEKSAFKVGKKIFATLDIKANQACLKLSEMDQDVFSAYDRSIIFPATGKWGIHGWTLIVLQKIPLNMFKDALILAYTEVAPRKLSMQLKDSIARK